NALSLSGSPPNAREPAAPLGLEARVVSPLGAGADRFYDDNTWVALAACAEHRRTGDPRLLWLARRLAAFVRTGWSETESWAHPGGIRWKEPSSNRSRNTCVNAPAAELSCELFALTGDPGHLEWAIRGYQWVRSALATSQGLYADQIAPDGTLTSTIWSYNQGTMIGAGVLLAGATGEERYLEDAERTARASSARYGNGGELDAQLPAFNAIYFRNLFLLDALRPDPNYRELARGWTDRVAASQLDRHGLVRSTESVLGATAAFVEVEALLAGAPPGP
ncbi:MAG: glycoside hydrolase family 76, partial [Acidimicrobiaceae bacterium]|nr:glycoside hydrolase family 76 [Acidimicrobiaceae bacterium]